MSLWVCSKWNKQPTDAEKWEVSYENAMDYGVQDIVCPRLNNRTIRKLPKSDYRPCDPPQPPERWIDVSQDCEFFDTFNRGSLIHYGDHSMAICERFSSTQKSYRLRKVQLLEPVLACEKKWAFVIEKKESA